jgi:hypothetical protein
MNKSMYQLEFYARSHFFTSSITSSALPVVFEGSREVEIIWERKMRVLWWVRNNSLSMCDCFLCGHALSCWRRILATFLWRRTLLKRFCKVLRVANLQISVRGLTTWNNFYQNYPFCSKNVKEHPARRASFFWVPLGLSQNLQFVKHVEWPRLRLQLSPVV